MANNNDTTQAGAAATPNMTSSDYLGALESAVRANPLSAALIGMGALWLFTGGNTTPFFGTSRRETDFHSSRSAPGTTGDAVRSVAGAVGSSLSAVASGVVDTVRNVSSHVTETVHDVGHAAAKAARDTGVATQERASEVASNTAHYFQDSGAKLGSALQRDVGHLFHEQPLLLGLIGIAIGGGIAATLPTTEAEQQLMGETSEMVQEQVSSAAAQLKELADTALDEAKAQF